MKTRPLTLSVLLLLFILPVIDGCTHPSPMRNEAGSAAEKKIVVAVVNNAPITMDALVRAMNRTKVPNHGELPAEYQEQVMKAALDRLILQELVLQRAKTSGITADGPNVEHLMANLREQLGGDQQVAAFLKKEGFSETDLTAQVERSLVLEKIYSQEVTAKAVVSEEELQRTYELERKKLIQPEKLVIVDVVVFLKEGEDKAMKRAMALKEQIAGAKDQDPWRLVLDGSFLVRALDQRKAPDKNRLLFDAARSMKQNEISNIIKSEDGLHIIKLTEHAPERPMTFEEAKPALEARLRGMAAQKRFEEWTQELKANAEIVIREELIASSQAQPAVVGDKNN